MSQRPAVCGATAKKVVRMMEINRSVGQIAKALKDSGTEDNTLVIFTSDK